MVNKKNKKSTIKKELRSTIKLNIKRYLSLIIMIFLGTAFFIGMRISSSVLQNTMISYFEKHNYADIKVATSVGLSENDFKSIKRKVSEIEEIEGKYYKEVISNIKDRTNGKKDDKVFAVHSYSKSYKLNKVELKEGKYISSNKECLVDYSLKEIGYKLGDIIVLNDELLDNKEYKIVGFINDPQYISIDKGTSDLLTGKIDYFVYIDRSNFKVEDNLYIIADIKLKYKYKTFSDQYNNYLEDSKKEIADKSKTISEKRKKEIIDEKSKGLEKAEAEYNAKKAEVEEKLAEAERQIQKAEREINYAESKIMSNKEIDTYLSVIKGNLDSSKAQLDSLKSTIDGANQTLDDIANYNSTAELKSKLQSLQGTIETTNSAINNMRTFLNEYENTCSQLTIPTLIDSCNTTLAGLRSKVQEQEENINQIQNASAKISEIISYIDENMDSSSEIIDIESNPEFQRYKQYIRDLESTYNSGLAKYNEALNEYNYAYANLKPKNAQARATLNSKKAELDKAVKDLDNRKKEAYGELEKVYNTIKENKKLLKNLEGLDWQVFTRNDSYGYSNYYNDTQKISNLSRVFPMLFFIVASLVTATSITRLIQEERSKIGILKSLGYSKKQIMKKYLYYSFTAAIIGCLLGIVTGLLAFPIIFVKVYSLLYFIPKIKYGLYIKEILLAGILSLISTVCIAYFASKNMSNEKPSDLLRPKVIRNSKKTLLEKNKGLWKKLAYIKRITYRNIFLNIGRSFMTIIGIAGCTTLIIASFGVRDSIQDVLNMQFNRVFDISVEFFYKSNITQYEMEEEEKRIQNLDYIEHASLNRMEMSTIRNGSKSDAVHTIIPNDTKKLDNEIKLYNIKNNQKVDLANTKGIVITEKLSKVLNLKVGDRMTYTDSSNIEHSAEVSAIVENYISNYIYMNKQTYKRLYRYESANNTLITKYKDGKSEKAATAEIYDNNKHSGFLSMIYYRDMTENVLKTFDIVLYIIIIAAGLLAFVVLYNLAKINISERITEVATLKVLGYDSKKINKYINYEINILTYIGILLGIIGGYFITDIIITTCEVDFIMFYHGISYLSYILGIFLTIIFSKVINLIVRQDLKQISITESLKSID